MNDKNLGNQAAELSELLSTTIGSVAQAQEKMDDYTQAKRELYEQAAEGSFALPPLWYVFSNIEIEMELSASVSHTVDKSGQTKPHIISKTLNPQSVGLYGHHASSGLRVRVHMTPKGFLPIKDTPSKTVNRSVTSDSQDD